MDGQPEWVAGTEWTTPAAVRCGEAHTRRAVGDPHVGRRRLVADAIDGQGEVSARPSHRTARGPLYGVPACGQPPRHPGVERPSAIPEQTLLSRRGYRQPSSPTQREGAGPGVGGRTAAAIRTPDSFKNGRRFRFARPDDAPRRQLTVCPPGSQQVPGVSAPSVPIAPAQTGQFCRRPQRQSPRGHHYCQ